MSIQPKPHVQSVTKDKRVLAANLLQICPSNKLGSEVKVLSLCLLQVIGSFFVRVLQVALVCVEHHSLHMSYCIRLQAWQLNNKCSVYDLSTVALTFSLLYFRIISRVILEMAG